MMRRDYKKPRKIDLPVVLTRCGNIKLGGRAGVRAPTGALGKLCNTRVSDRAGKAQHCLDLAVWDRDPQSNDDDCHSGSTPCCLVLL